MTGMVFRLWSVRQAYEILAQTVWPMVKESLAGGNRRLVLEVKDETRSLAENAMLHALLTAISRQMEWAGKKRDVETWKRLTTAAWLRARGEHVEMLPALDGHGVDVVFRRTSQLDRGECAELIEWVLAFCAENGIQTREPRPTAIEHAPRQIAGSAKRVDPETGEIIEAAA